MTKQDILNMKTTAEVNKTIFTHPELWDEELRDFVVKLKRKENLEKYGSEEFLPSPIERKAPDK